jgi:hypothetical protein
MDAQMLLTARELHSRVNDGIVVRLLWLEPDDRVVVDVSDAKTGAQFVVEVRDGDRAMDVFKHPYAYAAWRGIATLTPSGPGTGSSSPAARSAAPQ